MHGWWKAREKCNGGLRFTSLFSPRLQSEFPHRLRLSSVMPRKEDSLQDFVMYVRDLLQDSINRLSHISRWPPHHCYNMSNTRKTEGAKSLSTPFLLYSGMILGIALVCTVAHRSCSHKQHPTVPWTQRRLLERLIPNRV